MTITLFVEVFPNESAELIGPKKIVPTQSVLLKKLVIELSQIHELDVMYLEGHPADFPKEGIVLYYPYSGKFSKEYFKGINHHNRVILLGIAQSEIKELLQNCDLAAHVSMMSLLRYGDKDPKFMMYGKLAICHSKEIEKDPYSIISDEPYVFLDYKKFTGLADAIAWFLKALMVELSNQSAEPKDILYSQIKAQELFEKILDDIKTSQNNDIQVLSSIFAANKIDSELLHQEASAVEVRLENLDIELKNLKGIYFIAITSFSIVQYQEPCFLHIVFSKSEFLFHIGFTIELTRIIGLENHLEELNSVIKSGEYKEYLKRILERYEMSRGVSLSEYFEIAKKIKHPFEYVFTQVSKTHCVVYIKYKYVMI